MKLSEIAARFDGALVSDGSFETLAFGTSRPGKPFLTFLEKDKFLQAILENEQATCVLTKDIFAERLKKAGKGVIICSAPRAKLFEIHNELLQSSTEKYIAPAHKTEIGQNCEISPLAYISPHNVTIGNHVIIEPFAMVRDGVTIRDGCIIRTGAVIGAHGYNFAAKETGEKIAGEAAGNIVLDEQVDIAEGCIIEAPMFSWEQTYIGFGVKLGPNVVIEHGSTIGNNSLITAKSCVCGNVTVGSDCWVGVGSVISNRLTIGDNARISIGAVVTKDVPANTTVSGNFAIEHQRFLKNLKRSLKDEDE